MRDYIARRSVRRVGTALVAGAALCGAMPAAASADAADVALGGVIVHASAQGVITSGSSMTIVVECSAVSVAPAASTRVSCTAGPARANLALPGPVAVAAGTGSGPIGPFTVCVAARTHSILGDDFSASGCQPSIGMTGVVVAAS